MPMQTNNVIFLRFHCK